MKINLAILISFVVVALSCSRQKQELFQETEDGLLYIYRVRSEQTQIPVPGDRLLLRIAYYNEHDSLMFDSRMISPRFIQEFIHPTDSIPSIFHAYAMMTEGDSITFKLDAEHFFSSHKPDHLPKGVTKGDMLRFEIRLDKIFDQDEFLSEADKILLELAEQEQFRLEEFIASNYPDAIPTKTGLYYIEEREGSGVKPSMNSEVLIHYSVSYLDGQLLYSTVRSQNPLSFRMQDEFVWPGLREGVSLMKVGGLATMILPSDLAAGREGEDPIPPCTSVILRVQLLGVR